MTSMDPESTRSEAPESPEPETDAVAEVVPAEVTAPTPPAAAGEQFVLTIGDIGVSQSWIVTPNGKAPLKDSQWIVLDHTRTETKIPPYAIVLAIIFALACLIGLLFLLIKQTVISGYVEVSVRSGSLAHVTQIPVSTEGTVRQVRQQVSQAQSLAAQAPEVS
jgi:hypothetical protein